MQASGMGAAGAAEMRAAGMGWVGLRTRATALLCVLALAGCGDKGAAPGWAFSKPWSDHALSAEIRTTTHGVAHIKADSLKGAGYGYGYVFARDNLCLFAEALVTLHGERSKYFGEPNGSNNLDSDFFHKSIMTQKQAHKMKAASSAGVRGLVQGYVAGYNRYLKEHGTEDLPGKCKDADWIQPMTEEDVYLRVFQIGLVGGIDRADRWIGSAQPPSGRARGQSQDLANDPENDPARDPQFRQASGQTQSQVEGKMQGQPQDPAPAAAADTAPWESPLIGSLQTLNTRAPASNAYGLGREATQSGAGMVLGNPHFPWGGALRLHQVHLTVPGLYNVYGGALLGFPLPMIGFNQSLAWSHTFSTNARLTLFALKLDPDNPTKYMVDGLSKPMSQTRLVVEVKQPDGSLKKVARTLYGSEFGPLVADSGYFAWGRETAYAARDVNQGNLLMMDQFLLNGMAADVEGLRKAAATHTGQPWVNTIAADRAGHALYANYSATPNLPDGTLGGCLRSREASELIARVSIPLLDGSDSTCNWSGMMPADQLPYVIRNDYVTNANDSHWLSNDKVRLADFPVMVAPGRVREGVRPGERTRSAIAQVLDRVEGRDGLEGKGFTLALLQKVFQKSRFFSAEVWLDEFLAATCSPTPSARAAGGTGQQVDLAEACAVLKAWDKTEGQRSAGALLFREFFDRLGTLSDDGYWSTAWDPSDPVNTPRGFDSTNTKAASALADTVLWMKEKGIGLAETTMKRQGVTRGNRFIPLPGGKHIFNNWVGTYKDGLYTEPAFGNSYIQFVTFDANGPVAEGITTYSQSSNPASPHFSDMTERYSSIFLNGAAWMKLLYREADIKADPAYSTRMLKD